ncbi:hypothetical protein JQC92_03245 [Shewanella sp. 202IG2-18]|uniref:hypothetical protein n=1 Tax=Parashewanella hymeniacidonis TaxID=2807618 RepID=UPI0019611DF1|nr:hypothetical protein [Parashewanella hymeniacidonis]MBM7071058.1 hypothetical protein [Parashewanella hymeniacidonis]
MSTENLSTSTSAITTSLSHELISLPNEQQLAQFGVKPSEAIPLHTRFMAENVTFNKCELIQKYANFTYPCVIASHFRQAIEQKKLDANDIHALIDNTPKEKVLGVLFILLKKHKGNSKTLNLLILQKLTEYEQSFTEDETKKILPFCVEVGFSDLKKYAPVLSTFSYSFKKDAVCLGLKTEITENETEPNDDETEITFKRELCFHLWHLFSPTEWERVEDETSKTEFVLHELKKQVNEPCVKWASAQLQPVDSRDFACIVNPLKVQGEYGLNLITTLIEHSSPEQAAQILSCFDIELQYNLLCRLSESKRDELQQTARDILNKVQVQHSLTAPIKVTERKQPVIPFDSVYDVFAPDKSIVATLEISSKHFASSDEIQTKWKVSVTSHLPTHCGYFEFRDEAGFAETVRQLSASSYNHSVVEVTGREYSLRRNGGVRRLHARWPENPIERTMPKNAVKQTSSQTKLKGAPRDQASASEEVQGFEFCDQVIEYMVYERKGDSFPKNFTSLHSQIYEWDQFGFKYNNRYAQTVLKQTQTMAKEREVSSECADKIKQLLMFSDSHAQVLTETFYKQGRIQEHCLFDPLGVFHSLYKGVLSPHKSVHNSYLQQFVADQSGKYVIQRSRQRAAPAKTVHTQFYFEPSNDKSHWAKIVFKTTPDQKELVAISRKGLPRPQA